MDITKRFEGTGGHYFCQFRHINWLKGWSLGMYICEKLEHVTLPLHGTCSSVHGIVGLSVDCIILSLNSDANLAADRCTQRRCTGDKRHIQVRPDSLSLSLVVKGLGMSISTFTITVRA